MGVQTFVIQDIERIESGNAQVAYEDYTAVKSNMKDKENEFDKLVSILEDKDIASIDISEMEKTEALNSEIKLLGKKTKEFKIQCEIEINSFLKETEELNKELKKYENFIDQTENIAFVNELFSNVLIMVQCPNSNLIEKIACISEARIAIKNLILNIKKAWLHNYKNKIF